MKPSFRILILPAIALAAAMFTHCESDDDALVGIPTPALPGPDLMFYGLSASDSLVGFNANNTAAVLSKAEITGLSIGETLMAIDFRPATGQLYGIGSTSRLYIINQSTGVATAVGDAAFIPAISGAMAGFDFDASSDRARILTSDGQNLLLNPDTGAVIATDAALNPGTPQIGAAAYNNNIAGAGISLLYTIDFSTSKLLRLETPSNGTMTEIGSLNATISTGTKGEFDIAPDSTVALACLTVAGINTLFRVDLTNGRAQNLGALATPVVALAIQTQPVAYAVDGTNNLQIFNPKDLQAPTSIAISNIQADEAILGIDMRPKTGQLYALGSTGRIYTINPSNAVATAVTTTPFTLDGTDFGFDFNPVADRIRITSNTGQNIRVNPITGDIAGIDTALNPDAPNVSASAYDNNFSGTATTTLFDIDVTTDILYRQEPPNSGTLALVGSLGVDVLAANGFDISGTTNTGYALLSTAAGTKLYTIDTGSGLATAIADYPNTVRGFCIGLGF